jgi:dCMP deaminase
MIRDSWDQYFINIAIIVATRSTCDRKHVGAVIVKNNSILATGYNGSICGMPHCDDIGHLMENNHCIRTVHAEANAISQAARHGVSINKSSIYVTASPCYNCFSLIINSGIKKIVYYEFYRDERILEISRKLGIDLFQVNPTITL